MLRAIAVRPVLLCLLVTLGGCPSSPAETHAPPPAATSAAPAASAPSPSGQLAFAVHGKPLRTLSRAQLSALGEVTFRAHDPYYGKPKTWRAVPLRAVLERGFAGHDAPLAEQHLVLRALDGYTVPVGAARLLEDGGYVALADVDVPAWEPIGPQQVSPAPFYLVWRKPEQQDPTAHPRPWQLASIEIARFEASFPHTVPDGEPEGAPAWRGLSLFREQCIRCHAVNREGGRVGPDLNVPQSIVEYRPEPQIRAFIRKPSTFRYGNMPEHPSLTDADLDAIVAYFHAMRARKHDPDAQKPGH